MKDLPPLALSIRQPWAWAVVAGHKPIENRSAGSIRAGRMDCRRICIHAATGLKQDEFQWAHWRLYRHGVRCPRPDALPRGAIIGHVDVVEIIDQSDSEWFGGKMGLRLENAVQIDPIPAVGALGYFEWRAAGELAPVKPWMRQYQMAGEGELFPDLEPSFRVTPKRPGG